jgi:mono/diheme cytochrome c family protein
MLSLKSVGFALSLGAVVTVASAAEQEVSFKQDVMPILQTNCLECHSPGGKGAVKSGLLLDSYEHLMKGTKYGPVIDPGHSLNSPFIQVIEGKQVHKSIRMPHGGKELSAAGKKVLKDWVDQGAKNN